MLKFYQPLGQTGIKTSALGFGCVLLTSHPTRAQAIRILDHALSAALLISMQPAPTSWAVSRAF